MYKYSLTAELQIWTEAYHIIGKYLTLVEEAYFMAVPFHC